ncbi:hypothetical protein ACTFIV_001369 [Dictyostelium citrinum]
MDFSTNKKGRIIFFILIIISLGLLATSFGTFWYKYEVNAYDDEEDKSSLTNYYSYNKRKQVIRNYDGEIYSDETITRSTDGVENEIAIYKASLSFSIMAFICVVIVFVSYLFSFCGFIDNVPLLGPLMGLIGKFILIPGTIFCLISVFIFVGLGNARNKDCDCDTNKFIYKSESEILNGKYYEGPIEGWAVVVCATAFVLATAIYNIVGPMYK